MEIIENGNVYSENGVSLTPKQDNRRIACNMRDVINSTKKKERQHHRRKKENIKKFEPEIIDISSIMNDTLNIVSPNVSVEEIKDNKTPLKENSTQKNKKRGSRTKVLCRDPAAVGSIKAHFSPKPKASDPVQDETDNSNKKMNAFEVMMNARNKSIGSNTPGRAPDKIDGDVPVGEKSPAAVKRKLMLEEWADKKGASKRKLEDEAREEYIELELKKRAKRLKGMLVNGKDSTTGPSSTSKDVPSTSKKSKSEQKKSSNAKKGDQSVKEQPKVKSKKLKSSKGPTKKRIRRISSIDTDESLDKPISKTEDVEFVSKLSSPIKKRDSLLGYFSKVVSPDSASKLDINPTETATDKIEKVIQTELECNGNVSKSKSKRKSELNETPTSASTPTIISSRRPKRLCAGKARYDYDLEKSPSKNSDIDENSKRRSKRHIKANAVTTEDIIQINSKDTLDLVEIINLDVSVDENISKNNDNLKELMGKKLAPVFVKAVPKPAPDPEKVKARQEFLMSGVPEKMRLEIAKQRQFELLYENEVDYFPKISHVLQIDPIEFEGVSHLGNIKNVVTLKLNEDSPNFKIRKLKAAILIEPSLKLVFIPLQKLPDIEHKRMFIKKLKEKYEKFPTYRCYNQLREKYRSFSAKDTELDTQQLTESFVVTSSSRRYRQKQTATSNPGEDKPPLSAPNGELLFTEKYKPMTSEQVLVNIAPVQELREFLSSWQIGRNNKINDSCSDFELNDSNSNTNGLCNSVVLLGPSSSGKTNAVFALANELNFNVLEINAGMKRTGKKLLQELQESTQSHQVGKDNSKSNLLKLSLNGLKKKTENNDSNSSLDCIPNSSKLSLILVEDADIVFEQDAGFIEAIYQLSATSKRPVIIIANDPNCQHLLRLINQHSITFTKPNILNISKFLSILSLIENCPIDLDDIVSLYLYNHRNLRKTLLEMQFFIQSGGDRMRRKANNPHFVLTSPTRLSVESDTSKKDDQDDYLDENNEKRSPKIYIHKTLFEFYTTCQNVGRIVPFPIDFNILWGNLGDIFKISPNLRSSFFPKQIGRRISPRKKNNPPKYANELQTLTEFYENLSTATYITPDGHIEKDFCQPRLADEISHHLVEKSLKINLNAGVVSYNLFSKEKDRTLLTSYISSHQLRPNRSVALDYEPCLRSICRSEQHRSHVDRRGSRFYHYLRNTCNNLNSFSTDLFDNSCSVLIDKND